MQTVYNGNASVDLRTFETTIAVNDEQLRSDVDLLKDRTARHEIQIAKLDEAVAGLRDALARVATRTDVDALRRDVTQTFAQAARDAQNSIPVKVTAWFTGAMVLVSALALFFSLVVHLHNV